MTGSASYSTSFTITNARHVGAKIGADLRMLKAFYGSPSFEDIEKYVEEAALLLNDGYLGTDSFGFWNKSENAWKFRLRYTATAGGQLVDSKPGSYPPGLSLSGYSFHSHLTYSAKYNALTSTEQAAVKSKLPWQRIGAQEPSASAGSSTSGHGYSSGGAGVNRDVYVEGGL